MTKEQSEAIERIKYLIFIYKKDDEKGYRATGDVFDTDFKAIETVLNMLKEKDSEIEKYKKKNKELSNQILILYKEQDDYNARIDKKNTELKKKNEELDMYKDIKEITNSKATELVKLKQYDDLKKKADRQDKMINKSIRYMEDTFVLEEDKCITELYNILKGSIR